MTGWVNINNPDQEGSGDITGGGGGDTVNPDIELE